MKQKWTNKIIRASIPWLHTDLETIRSKETNVCVPGDQDKDKDICHFMELISSYKLTLPFDLLVNPCIR